MMEDQYGPWRRVTIAGQPDQHAYVNLDTNTCFLSLPSELESVWGNQATQPEEPAEIPVFTHNKNFMVNTNTSFSDAEVNSPTSQHFFNLNTPTAVSENTVSSPTSQQVQPQQVPQQPQSQPSYIFLQSLSGWNVMFSYDHNRIYFSNIANNTITLWTTPPELREAEVANIENKFRSTQQPRKASVPPPRSSSSSVSLHRESLDIVPEFDLTCTIDGTPVIETESESSHDMASDALSTPRSMIVHSPTSAQVHSATPHLPNFAEEDEDSGATAAAAVRLVVSVGEQTQPTTRRENSSISTDSVPPPFTGTSVTPPVVPPPYKPQNMRTSGSSPAPAPIVSHLQLQTAASGHSAPRPPPGPAPSRLSFRDTDSGRNSYNDSGYNSIASTPQNALLSPRPPPFTFPNSNQTTPTPVAPAGPRPPATLRVSDSEGHPVHTVPSSPAAYQVDCSSNRVSRHDMSNILNEGLKQRLPGMIPPPGPPAGPPPGKSKSISGNAPVPMPPSGPRTLAAEVAEIEKKSQISYSGPCEKRTTGITRRALVPRYLRIEEGILTHWTSFMEVTIAEGKPRGYMSVVGAVIHLAPSNTGIDPSRGFEIYGLRNRDRVLYQVQFVHSDECEAWVYALVRNGAADCRFPFLASDIYVGKNRKLLHGLLYKDRIELFPSAAEVATTSPTQVISFTRGTSITPNTSEVNSIFLDVSESQIRDVKAASHSIGFEDSDTMQVWGAEILKAIRGPLGVVFGGELGHLTKISPFVVPEVVHLCIQRILECGLQEEGLLRVPGSDMQISEIKNAFNNNVHTVKDMLKDPNTVAGVFKVFFRELLDSVVPIQKYEAFTSLDCRAGTPASIAEKALKVKSLVEDLPIENQYCLNYVIYLLTKISSHSTVNKMNAKNCAMVLAPGLLRSPISNDNDLRSFSKMSEQEAVIELMINHYTTIFPRGSPYSLEFVPVPKKTTKRGGAGPPPAGPPPAGPPPSGPMTPSGTIRIAKNSNKPSFTPIQTPSQSYRDGNNGGPIFD